jgi:hypothetical protein
MASALDYIASVNASASQLRHVQPMTVQDVYALVTLMGLYLSEASGHQKAYKEILAHIDDGHALTLDKVQHEIIRFSHFRAPRAFALTHAGDSSVCNHRCPRCCNTRGETPRPSRSSSSPRSPSSSRAGSPRRTFSATAFPVNSVHMPCAVRTSTKGLPSQLDDPNWWTHSLLREGYGKDKHWVLLGLPSRDYA